MAVSGRYSSAPIERTAAMRTVAGFTFGRPLPPLRIEAQSLRRYPSVLSTGADLLLRFRLVPHATGASPAPPWQASFPELARAPVQRHQLPIARTLTSTS